MTCAPPFHRRRLGAAVLIALLGAGGCALPPSTGAACASGSDCGRDEHCVAYEDTDFICVPALDLANIPEIEAACDSTASCRSQGWPIEAVCVEGRCGCDFDRTDELCQADQVLKLESCLCVDSEGALGDPCFDLRQCVSPASCDLEVNECGRAPADGV
jgi:hypothetical protein